MFNGQAQHFSHGNFPRFFGEMVLDAIFIACDISFRRLLAATEFFRLANSFRQWLGTHPADEREPEGAFRSVLERP
jgi:hypothetical protein